MVGATPNGVEMRLCWLSQGVRLPVRIQGYPCPACPPPPLRDVWHSGVKKQFPSPLLTTPAANSSPAGFRPPPPSALARVGALLSGVKMRACWVSQGVRQSCAMKVCCFIPGCAPSAPATSWRFRTSSLWLAAKAMGSDAGAASGISPACAISAAFSWGGSSFPRSLALRRIPRQAVLLK